jgi:hypothetical protein
LKAQAAETENWNCDKCRAEKVRMLQEELQNAPRKVDELKARNRDLGAKLQMAGTGKRDTMPTEQKFTKCMVVADNVAQRRSRTCRYEREVHPGDNNRTATQSNGKEGSR